jgi:hypothetical protein
MKIGRHIALFSVAIVGACGTSKGGGESYMDDDRSGGGDTSDTDSASACDDYGAWIASCDAEYTPELDAQCNGLMSTIEANCGELDLAQYADAYRQAITCLTTADYCPGDDLSSAASACYDTFYADTADVESRCLTEDEEPDTGDTGTPPPGSCTPPETIAFAPEAPGTQTLTLYDDDVSEGIPIGFSLTFFGSAVDTLYVSSNGFVGWSPDLVHGCCEGQVIPAPDHVNGIVALGWTDLSPAAGGTIAWDSRGDAPDRRFILDFSDVPWPYDAGGTLSAQLIIREADHSLELHTTQLTAGAVTTQGVEAPDGSRAICEADRVASSFGLTNDARRFTTDTVDR